MKKSTSTVVILLLLVQNANATNLSFFGYNVNPGYLFLISFLSLIGLIFAIAKIHRINQRKKRQNDPNMRQGVHP